MFKLKETRTLPCVCLRSRPVARVYRVQKSPGSGLTMQTQQIQGPGPGYDAAAEALLGGTAYIQ